MARWAGSRHFAFAFRQAEICFTERTLLVALCSAMTNAQAGNFDELARRGSDAQKRQIFTRTRSVIA